MALHEIESQLLDLSIAEKAQAIQRLLKSIGNLWPGIEKTADVCGGDARIAHTRIPVWVLVQAQQLGNSETDLLQNYPTLSACDLANAWGYAAAHSEEIELATRDNEAA